MDSGAGGGSIRHFRHWSHIWIRVFVGYGCQGGIFWKLAKTKSKFLSFSIERVETYGGWEGEKVIENVRWENFVYSKYILYVYVREKISVSSPIARLREKEKGLLLPEDLFVGDLKCR